MLLISTPSYAWLTKYVPNNGQVIKDQQRLQQELNLLLLKAQYQRDIIQNWQIRQKEKKK